MAGSLRASVFNAVLPTADPGRFVVYNTLHRTVAEIPRSALPLLGWNEAAVEEVSLATQPGALKSLTGEGPGQLLSPQPPSQQSGPGIEQFKELRFLVEASEDEYVNLHEYLSAGYTPKVFYPVVAFTAACNLACVYCFEEGLVDRSQTMSNDKAVETVAWIRRYAEDHDVEAISLGLFGGEPLLDLRAANYFIDEVSRIANTLVIPFQFGITTNGTRLTRELMLDWAARGLQEVRVTLDGPKDVHDARRYHRGNRDKGSFDCIMERLTAVADVPGFNITIEVNIDAENYTRVDELLDTLEGAGLKNRVLVVPEQTLATLASSAAGEDGCGTCSSGGCSTANVDPAWFSSHTLGGDGLAEAFVRAVDQIAGRGFRMPEMVGVYYPCIFVQKHHVVIDWRGDMYKCSFTIGNNDMSVGDVSRGFNWRNEDMLGSVRIIDWCKARDCAYIPICGGGCRYEAYNASGSYHEPTCKAELIDKVLPRTLPYAFGIRPVSARQPPRGAPRPATPLRVP